MAEWTVKEHSQCELTVKVSGEEWTKAQKKAFAKIAKNVHINGFRKGSVPKALLQKWVREEAVLQEAATSIIENKYKEALDETGLHPLDQASADITDMDRDSVEFVFTFPVAPEVKLGEYKGLPFHVDAVEVSDEEIYNEMNNMRETYAEMETVEGGAEMGHTVNIDYEGFKDGETFEGGKGEGFDLVLGSHRFIPGFEEQLVGAEAGEEKELHVTFPEDYYSEELSGAEAVFKVKVNEVKNRVLPELDDDFAKDVSVPGVETAEDLRNVVKERLEDYKRTRAEREAEGELVKKLVEVCEVDPPEVMIEMEEKQILQQFRSQLAQNGMNLETYLDIIKSDEKTMKDSYRDTAIEQIKNRLCLEAVAKAEGFEISEDDIENEYKEIAAMYSTSAETIKSALSEDDIKPDILVRKAIDFLKENAVRDDA